MKEPQARLQTSIRTFRSEDNITLCFAQPCSALGFFPLLGFPWTVHGGNREPETVVLRFVMGLGLQSYRDIMGKS